MKRQFCLDHLINNRLVTCLFLTLILVVPSHAATIRVSSVSAANSVGSPGDIILITPGTYSTSLRPRTSGTSGNPITYRGDGGAVTIQGTSQPGINLDQRNYIVVDNFRLIELNDAFVALTSGAHHNTIQMMLFNIFNNQILSGI